MLAKHGQIYEPARLSNSALTTDILSVSSGRLDHMGHWDSPNTVICEGAVSQEVRRNHAFYKSWLVNLILILLFVYRV